MTEDTKFSWIPEGMESRTQVKELAFDNEQAVFPHYAKSEGENACGCLMESRGNPSKKLPFCQWSMRSTHHLMKGSKGGLKRRHSQMITGWTESLWPLLTVEYMFPSKKLSSTVVLNVRLEDTEKTVRPFQWGQNYFVNDIKMSLVFFHFYSLKN